MIHRAEEEDAHEEWENNQRGRNDHRLMQMNDNRGNRRDSYRRRSRSRSPRNVRHRPYHDFRYNNNNNSGSQNNQASTSNFQNHNQNAAQFFHQLSNYSNNQRFYNERGENYQPYFPNNFQNHHFNGSQQYGPGYSNANRCYVCGSADHLARFCPRR